MFGTSPNSVAIRICFNEIFPASSDCQEAKQNSKYFVLQKELSCLLRVLSKEVWLSSRDTQSSPRGLSDRRRVCLIDS